MYWKGRVGCGNAMAKVFVVKEMLREQVKIDGVEYEIIWFNTGEYEKHALKPCGSGHAYTSVPFIPTPHQPIALRGTPTPKSQIKDIFEIIKIYESKKLTGGKRK